MCYVNKLHINEGGCGFDRSDFITNKQTNKIKSFNLIVVHTSYTFKHLQISYEISCHLTLVVSKLENPIIFIIASSSSLGTSLPSEKILM